MPYSFHVVNTGGVPLTNISVTDVQTPPSSNANLGPITCAATTLAPGAQTACTATYTVTQADLDNGGVTNVATAQGSPPTGPPVVSDPNTLTIPAQALTAAVTVVKSSTTTSITSVGQQVPYRFLVANTGGLTLTNVAVTDVQTPPSSNANLGPITCAATTLAPGASTICTATYTVTQADLDNNGVTNVATARGTPPGGGTPVTSPPSTLTIPEAGLIAAIAILKTSHHHVDHHCRATGSVPVPRAEHRRLHPDRRERDRRADTAVVKREPRPDHLRRHHPRARRADPVHRHLHRHPGRPRQRRRHQRRHRARHPNRRRTLSTRRPRH